MTTYLITGANRGLGLEFVRQLSRRPDTRLLATAREPARANELDALAAAVIALDAGDPSSIDSLPSRLGDEPIDVLINNAGVSGETHSVAKLGHAELSRVFAVNTFGPLLVARSLLPNLRAGSKRTVVNISSQLGSIGNNSGGSTYEYRASKAALNQLTVCLANELRAEKFTCVAVHPGWVRTDMGGPNATLGPDASIASLLRVIDSLTPADSGRFLNYDGTTLPW